MTKNIPESATKTITDRLFALSKAWKKLEADQRDLNYRRSVWCADARACFSSDDGFHTWAMATLGITHFAARELLELAETVALVPDSTSWNQLGGKKLTALLTKPKREQASIIEEAKREVLTVPTVIRNREKASKPAPAPVPYKPIAAKPVVERTHVNKGITKDIGTLARFVLGLPKSVKLPNEIEMIARMYK